MNASDLFIKALENEGVEYIFGVPGEENLDFLEAMRKSNIKLILTRHEQGAGFMAATYGRLTGRVGVCLATLGPGATNFATSAAYAQLGGMPMMMITGQKPIKKSKQGRFQIIDIVRMMRPMTKFAKQIVNVHNIPSVVRDAFKIATTERPGAVHIELPEDIAHEPVDADTTIYPVYNVKYPAAVDEVIAEAVAMIEKAKRPLLLIGAGANRTRIGNTLTDLVNKTGMAFFSTQMGKGVIDENHPMCLSAAALSKDDFVHCAIDRAVFNSTIIEDGVRIDNLVHIAHNCKIGRGSILVGQVGLAGSTILNAYVVMGGQSATAGHLEIAPFTTIAARGGVTKSITESKKSWAGFPLFEHREWLKLQGKISNLLKK